MNTNNERLPGTRQPHQDIRRNISYFVRDSSFLNLLTTTVIEQVKWFPSVTILMESAARLGAAIILSSTAGAFCNLSTSPFYCSPSDVQIVLSK